MDPADPGREERYLEGHGFARFEAHSVFWEAQSMLIVWTLESILAEEASLPVGGAAPGTRAANLLYLLARCDVSNVRRRVYRWYRCAVDGTPYAAIDGTCPFRVPMAALEGADDRRPGGWPRGRPPPKRPRSGGRAVEVDPDPTDADPYRVARLTEEAHYMLPDKISTEDNNDVWQHTAQETAYAVLDAGIRNAALRACPLHVERARLRGWVWPEPFRANKERAALSIMLLMRDLVGQNTPVDILDDAAIAPLVQSVLSSVPGTCCIVTADGEEGVLMPRLVRCVLLSALTRFMAFRVTPTVPTIDVHGCWVCYNPYVFSVAMMSALTRPCKARIIPPCKKDMVGEKK